MVGSMHHQHQKTQPLAKIPRHALGNKTRQPDLSNTHHHFRCNSSSNNSNSGKALLQKTIADAEEGTTIGINEEVVVDLAAVVGKTIDLSKTRVNPRRFMPMCKSQGR